MPARWIPAALIALAAGQFATGLWLALSPGTFFDALADFGPRNDHDLRDMSAFYLAAGVVLVAAASRPSWRAPAVALVGLQYLLHTVNHVIDIADSDPGWVGPFDAVTLGAIALLLLAVWRATHESGEAPAAGSPPPPTPTEREVRT